MMRARMVRVWLGTALLVACIGVAHADDDGLTIDEAIRLALTRNERAQIADLTTEEAKAALEKARYAFFPIVNLSANGALRPTDKPKTTASTGLQLTQPIFAPSAFPLYSQAKHALEAQLASTADAKRVLAFQTAHSFFAVLLAQHVVEAAQRELDTANANVADTDAQFKAQLVSANDVTRARINQAGSVRELATDKGNLAASYVALAFMLNAKAAGRLAVPTALLDAGKQPIASVDPLVAQAIAQRPDLVAQRASALASHDFAREPRWRLLPSLMFVAGLDASSNTSSNPMMNNSGFDGSLALALSWTIFDGGNRYADAHSRDAAAAIADLNASELARSIESDVRTAAANLSAAQDALTGAKDAADQSAKSAEETAILYRQGLAKAIELVDANEQRFEADVSYAEAEYAVAAAYLDLRQALGLGPLEEQRK